MFRSQIQDSATSTAKSYGHETVEPRHVVFAIAKRLRQHPELSKYFDLARQKLEPHGRSHDTPALSEAATVLLASIANEADAVTAALNALKAPPSSLGKDEPAGGQARQSGAQAQATPAVEAATPSRRPRHDRRTLPQP